MNERWTLRDLGLDPTCARRVSPLRWLALVLLLGCGGQESAGEANFRLCHGTGELSCEEDSGDHRVEPALFSRTWSQFEGGGVAAMVAFDVESAEGETRRAVLWLDCNLAVLPVGKGGGLAVEGWDAQYFEHVGEETRFAGRSVTGSVVVFDQLLLDGQPPALRVDVDLTFVDGDDANVRVDGVLSTFTLPRDIDGGDQHPQGYSATDDEYYCYDCHYGCGGVYIEDSGDDSGSGCEGDDSSSDSGSGCEGDSADTGDSGSGCDGDSGSDSGCEGDANAAAGPAKRHMARGISLPRLLDLVVPVLLGVLLKARRRRT